MKRFLTFLTTLWAALLLAPYTASAHPHVFLEAEVTFVFDDEGLAGIRHRWVFDEMFTATILDIVDLNRNGTIDPDEVSVTQQEAFSNLENYDYFMAIHINGERFNVEWVTDFTAEVRDDGKLIYGFLVPCHVAAHSDPKEIKVAVYDETFYVFIAYGDGNSGFDPFADPMFADPTAPANPGDYDRFAGEAGLPVYDSDIPLEGPADHFIVQTEVKAAPTMRYFYDEIVPDAFILTFSQS
ncbi:MAG: DUF1007 family protein [Desulfovibrio sp.]|nr:MAG: DUF1007 family protein [Desulfovibrio sp.]